jgi:antitoxin Phd
MRTWQLQDARARFIEFLDASLRDGPQVVTRRGVEIAVLVSIDQWRRLQRISQPTLKELLLAEGPRFEGLVRDGGHAAPIELGTSCSAGHALDALPGFGEGAANFRRP